MNEQVPKFHALSSHNDFCNEHRAISPQLMRDWIMTQDRQLSRIITGISTSAIQVTSNDCNGDPQTILLTNEAEKYQASQLAAWLPY